MSNPVNPAKEAVRTTDTEEIYGVFDPPAAFGGRGGQTSAQCGGMRFSSDVGDLLDPESHQDPETVTLDLHRSGEVFVNLAETALAIVL
jgi:hypothetical protein